MTEAFKPRIPTHSELTDDPSHPDVPKSVADRMTIGKRRRLATHLTLRDIYMPMCVMLRDQVVALNRDEIISIAEGFDSKPGFHPYPKSESELEIMDRAIGAGSLSIVSMRMRRVAERVEFTGEDADELRANGRFESFCYAPTEIDRSDNFGVMIVPVGYYGEETAAKILTTGRILTNIAYRDLEHEAIMVGKEHGEILNEATSQGKQRDIGDFGKPVPLVVMIEGIDSFTSGLGFLLAEKIPNMEDGDSAVISVLVANELNHLAALMRGGFLMPNVLSGRYMPGVLTNTDGVLRIEHDAKVLFARFAESRRREREDPFHVFRKHPELAKVFGGLESVLEIGIGDPDEYSTLTGNNDLGCPVATKSEHTKISGIEALSEAFLQIYQAL